MTLVFRERERFGRFELRRFLGRGATGDVHLALDPEHDREVALKLVRHDGVDADALVAERRGAELQRRVAEAVPQVAAVFEAGDLDGYFYIAMEYVAGEDLSRVLARAREEPLPPERAVKIALELCAVVEELHGFSTRFDDREVRTVIHGDLKPENVRIESRDGGERVRLVDFGIAKHLTHTRQATRNLFGTYPYTPPERLRSGCVDSLSDLWAVGILLYQMVSGQQPYEGRTAEELERLILSRPPAPLPESSPAALRALLQRCLAFRPESRFQSATELRQALEGLLESPEALSTPPLARVLPLPSGATRRTLGGGARETTSTRQTTLGAPTRRTRQPEGLGDGHESVSAAPPALAAESAAWEAEAPTARVPDIDPPPFLDPRPPALPPLPPATAERSGLRGRWSRLSAKGRIAVLALAFVGLQFCAQNAAEDISRTLAEDSAPDAWSAWQRYRRAAWLVPFDLGLGDARDDVRSALVASGERVLHGFRQDIPSTRLADWQDASSAFRAALQLSHDDPAVRARLYYTQAHLDRLRAKSLEDRDSDGAERAWANAVFGFEQAAAMDPQWADPYLGLARIYAYEHFDLVKLLEALRAARARGIPWGKRELAQLADANRHEGMRLHNQAIELRGEGGEADLLYDARQHLESAIVGYERILSFGNARANRDSAREKLEAVNLRLREVRRPW
jgi:eukaryotic-like serine/threonine-protein kinase